MKGGAAGIAYYTSTDYVMPSSLPGKDGSSVSLAGKTVVFVGWSEHVDLKSPATEDKPEAGHKPYDMSVGKWVDAATNTFQVKVGDEVHDVVVPEKYYGQVSKFSLKKGDKLKANAALFTSRDVEESNRRAVEQAYRCAYRDGAGSKFYSNFITFRCCVSAENSAKVGQTKP